MAACSDSSGLLLALDSSSHDVHPTAGAASVRTLDIRPAAGGRACLIALPFVHRDPITSHPDLI